MLEACCLAWGVHLGTLHFDRSTNYNEFNLGLYVRSGRWATGAYWNSHRKPSAYIAYAFPLSQRWSLHAGFVSGYNKTVMPVAALSYSLDGGLGVSLIPSSPKGGSGGVHLSYEFHR